MVFVGQREVQFKKKKFAYLKFAKSCLVVPQCYWKNILLTNETILSCLEKNIHKHTHTHCLLYHQRESEFLGLSGHFSGECAAICLPVKAQQKFKGD